MKALGRKTSKRRMWLCCFVAGFLGMLFLFAGMGSRKALSKTVMEKTPINTEVKLVIPDTVADMKDDSMTIQITDYEFEISAYGLDYYYLTVKFVFQSLGNLGRTRWESRAAFYDQRGNVLNRPNSVDGFIESNENDIAAQLDKTFSYKLYVPSDIASDVSAIVFQEHYQDPASLPADPSMGEASYWDNVRVSYPPEIASMNDDTMRARIKNYYFENSETGQGYYLYINIEFTSLGRRGSMWASRAIFRDQYGNQIEGGIGDNYGYFGSATTIALGRSYTFGIEIPENIKKTVASIEFVESWAGNTNPSINPSVSAAPTAYPGGRKAQTVTAKNMKKTLGGKSVKLSVGGSYYTSLSFKSSDTKVAAVTGHGSYATIKLKKVGKVKITITAPETAQYKKAEKTITLKIVLAAPKLNVTVKGGIMTVSWNKVKGAAQYRLSVVQHGVRSTGMYTKKRILANGITKGKKYTVKVKALDSKKKFTSGWAKKTVKT